MTCRVFCSLSSRYFSSFIPRSSPHLIFQVLWYCRNTTSLGKTSVEEAKRYARLPGLRTELWKRGGGGGEWARKKVCVNVLNPPTSKLEKVGYISSNQREMRLFSNYLLGVRQSKCSYAPKRQKEGELWKCDGSCTLCQKKNYKYT